MSGNILWLAAYPKSGNTWMRILLTNYLRNGDEAADINSLDGGPIASARQVFDDHVGIEASDLTQDEIERYRPFVYEALSAQAEQAGRGPLLLKVHDAYTQTPYGYPLFPPAATAGVLYLVRNPLDVAVSLSHHGGNALARVVKSMGKPDAGLVATHDALPGQLHQKLLSWSQHVASWLDAPGLRVHIVRYEDLLADPIGGFSAVIRFCGLADDRERIAKAVEFSTFERLQAQEATSGFQERLPQATDRFFRRGQAGSWRAELAPALAAKLIADHRAMMERLGYATEIGIST